jgi:chromosome segregation ATPase
LDERNIDMNELRDRLDEILGQNTRLSEDKVLLERNLSNTNDLVKTQKSEIIKLIEDNQKLTKICSEQDRNIKNQDMDKAKLNQKIDELNFEIKNLQGRLMTREENISFLSRQLDEAKTLGTKQQNNIKDLENQNDKQRSEINSLNSMLGRERSLRIESDKSVEQLNNILNERENEINRYLKDLETSKNANQRSNDEKNTLLSENERLKNHIVLLTEHNEKVLLYII